MAKEETMLQGTIYRLLKLDDAVERNEYGKRGNENHKATIPNT
jgi:hypothetical protein